MQTPMPKNQPLLDSRKQAVRFIRVQLVVTLLLPLALLAHDRVAAYSAFAGGMVATVASAWFAAKVLRVRQTEQPETILAVFYAGEIVKFVFTGAMFIMVFVLVRPVNIGVLLGVYFIVHITPAVVDTFGGANENEK